MAVFNASRGEPYWDAFVSNTSACANTSASNAFDCLRTASIDDIVRAETIVMNSTNTGFGFVPTIDGPGGVLPDLPSTIYAGGSFSTIPRITGTNKDEGEI